MSYKKYILIGIYMNIKISVYISATLIEVSLRWLQILKLSIVPRMFDVNALFYLSCYSPRACDFPSAGTTEENLNKLIQHVKIEAEPEYITNWKELGVPIISSVREAHKPFLKSDFMYALKCRFSSHMRFCVPAAESVLFPEAI